MRKGELAHLARPGTEITTRVTPGARRNAIEADGDGLRVWVTAAPEDGKANRAVRDLLARGLGVPKSRVTLARGQTSRVKVWRLE